MVLAFGFEKGRSSKLEYWKMLELEMDDVEEDEGVDGEGER